MAVEDEGGEVSQTVIIEQSESGHLMLPAKRGRPPKGTHVSTVDMVLPGTSEQVELGDGELDPNDDPSIDPKSRILSKTNPRSGQHES